MIPEPEANLYRVADLPNSQVRFMLTAEDCTIFNYQNEFKKVHNVIMALNIEIAVQINEAPKNYGNLE